MACGEWPMGRNGLWIVLWLVLLDPAPAPVPVPGSVPSVVLALAPVATAPVSLSVLLFDDGGGSWVAAAPSLEDGEDAVVVAVV